jgi:hypothetical protein
MYQRNGKPTGEFPWKPKRPRSAQWRSPGRGVLDVIVDGGESAKSLNRPGLQRLLSLVSAAKVDGVIVAKLDRLTRSVKDLCGLLELFERRKVALVSVADRWIPVRPLGAWSLRSWARSASGNARLSVNGPANALGHKKKNSERDARPEYSRPAVTLMSLKSKAFPQGFFRPRPRQNVRDRSEILLLSTASSRNL